MRFAGSQISSFLGNSPNFGEMSNTYANARSQERNAATESEAYTANAGLNAMANIRSAEHQARAIEAEGAAQAASSQAQGMSGMMSGIAGGIGNMSFAGSSAASTPAFGTMPGTPVSTDYMNRLTSFYGA